MTYVPPVTVPTKSVVLIKRLFPIYRKRDVCIQVSNKVTFSDLNWSGGSRSTYTLVRLDDNATMSLAGWSTLAPWANPYEGAEFEMRPGFLVVQTGHFCGKESRMRIYVHPSNLTPMLQST